MCFLLLQQANQSGKKVSYAFKLFLPIKENQGKPEGYCNYSYNKNFSVVKSVYQSFIVVCSSQIALDFLCSEPIGNIVKDVVCNFTQKLST